MKRMRPAFLRWALLATALQAACGLDQSPSQRQASAPMSGKSAEPAPPPGSKAPQPEQAAAPAADTPTSQESGSTAWQDELLQRDARWLEQLADVGEGEDVSASDLPGELHEAVLRTAGLLCCEPQRYRRVAGLDLALPKLVPTAVEELSEIDCIVMISINCKPERPLYVFATLRSLFSSFPAGINVNILVGDEHADYLSERRLREEIGEDLASHVHVWAPSAGDGRYLREHLTLHDRGGWNYARALRSYRGHKNLLLMEDDVEWSGNAGVALNRRLREDPRALVSLYNRPGLIPPDQPNGNFSDASLGFVEAVDPEHLFFGTQGMTFSAKASGGMGNFLQIKLHEWPYDLQINSFMTVHGLRMAYAYPSIVQHIGFYGTGYGVGFHTSECFARHIAAGPSTL